MGSFLARVSAAFLMLNFAGVIACAAGDTGTGAVPKPAIDAARAPSHGEQPAVLPGGCSWGVQAVFQEVKAVTHATSGYAGGTANTAEYEVERSGETHHAEPVMLTMHP